MCMYSRKTYRKSNSVKLPRMKILKPIGKETSWVHIELVRNC